MLFVELAVLVESLAVGEHHLGQLLNTVFDDFVALLLADEILDFEVLLRVEGPTTELDVVDLLQAAAKIPIVTLAEVLFFELSEIAS